MPHPLQLHSLTVNPYRAKIVSIPFALLLFVRPLGFMLTLLFLLVDVYCLITRVRSVFKVPKSPAPATTTVIVTSIYMSHGIRISTACFLEGGGILRFLTTTATASKAGRWGEGVLCPSSSVLLYPTPTTTSSTQAVRNWCPMDDVGCCCSDIL